MANKVLVRLTTGECELRDLNGGDAAGPLTISAAVGLGGRNLPDDVKTIQAALNQVSPEQGGPQTKLEVNGKPGPALQQAIAAFQKRQFAWADSRVDTNNVTIQRLRTYQNDIPAGSTPSLFDRILFRPLTIGLVYATLPQVKSMVDQALATIDQGRLYLHGVSPQNKEAAEDKFAIIDTYFNLSQLPKARALKALQTMSGVFRKMQTVVGAAVPRFIHGTGYFQPDPQDQKNLYAFTYAGGFTRKDARTGRPKMSKEDNYTGPNLPEDAIYICTGLEGKEGDFVAYNTIHEMAHFVGPELGHPDAIHDLSYRHRNGFYSLSTQDALRTADSYAMFAVAANGKALTEKGTTKTTIFMPPEVIRG
jgi:hypothetical protein